MIRVGEASINLIQDGDSNEGNDQFLTVKLEDSGAGFYYVIETKRWAFDAISELVAVVENINQIKKQAESQ